MSTIAEQAKATTDTHPNLNAKAPPKAESTIPCKKTSMRYLTVLLSSLTLALCANFLISGGPLGFDFTLTVFLGLGAFCALKYYFKEPLKRTHLYLIGSAALFSLGFIFRDAGVLYALNILAIIIVCCIAIAKSIHGNIWNLTIIRWCCTPFVFIAKVLTSLFTLIKGCLNSPSINLSYKKEVVSILTGLLIAVPFIYVFGGLLVSSDARFENLIISIFDMNIEAALSWTWEYAVTLFFISAYLYLSLLHKNGNKAGTSQSKAELEGIVLITVLGCINALFILYITMQLSYFFGGDTLIIDTKGLTYSSFARQGFWELVWIAMIAIPFLYCAHWLQRNNSALAQRWFIRLSAVLLACISVIEFSALRKMYLYINAYGLTELRLYTTVFMLFLIASIVLFYRLVLRNKSQHYLPAILCIALATIALLNIINPNKVIAQYNIGNTHNSSSRVQELKDLGLDAIPYQLNTQDISPMRCSDIAYYENRLNSPYNWRKWSIADWRARKAINTWKAGHCAVR